VRRLRDEDLVVEEATTAHSRDEREGDNDEQPDAIHPQSDHSVNHLLPLEPEVLERLGCAPIELRGHLVLTTPRREVALGDPSGRAVADRRKLIEMVLGGIEGLRRFVEPPLLEQ
jgi:hypothetical protein